MGWLFKKRCSQCRREIPKGDALNKRVRVGNGSWVEVCKKCYVAMGNPGRLRNKIKQKQQREQRQQSG